MRPPAIPRATYRLQLHAGFGFAAAAELVPYLAALGISHCYCSPYLQARTGSPHGYDIVAHDRLNPELGTPAEFDAFTTALADHGMGQILDLVPNHMGVGSDNAWWLDVLEHGPASRHARFFDIDWRPAKDELRGKVLLALLGDHYGTVLDRGELHLEFMAEAGAFQVSYFQHRFPLDPRSYPLLLAEEPPPQALRPLLDSLGRLPLREARGAAHIRLAARCKRHLGALYRSDAAVAAWMEQCLAAVNGRPGEPASFDRLHAVLEAQAYRLAYWLTASHEINYRRFFDINELAGLRMEEPAVFEATHGLVLELIGAGRLHGLRLDHPDGLYDPLDYFHRLRAAIARVRGGEELYLVVEKILAGHEHLPTAWPVHGTTGYDFLNAVGGLLVQPAAERELTRGYQRFIGRRVDYDALLYEGKRLIMQAALASELNVLVDRLNRLSEQDRHTRDFTRQALHEALREVVACFPVYRTYITAEGIGSDDVAQVQWAVAQAKKRSPAVDVSIFDFIGNVLLLDGPRRDDPSWRKAAAAFVMKLQQYTAPVMAKGLEDTTFYRYHRLTALNEVGGDPRRFGVSPAAFHHHNQERQRHWPQAMLCTSSHDTKRSEDVRARLAVLSELPGEWHRRVARWSLLNRSRRRRGDDGWMPSRNDEYLLYQTLLGIWPLQPPDAAALEVLRERLATYLVKALREAKLHSSWINPNADYEAALGGFVAHLLQPDNAFLRDFQPFQHTVARLGLYNSLSQLLCKLSAPGVPDIYQGNELWDFSLVDPDNRRPVDYGRRRALLAAMQAACGDGPARAAYARGLLETLEDDRLKLYLTWCGLQLRAERPALFREGDYLPLTTQGAYGEQLLAYARRRGEAWLVAIIPRWFDGITAGASRPPLGEVWEDTWLELPAEATTWHNTLTGEAVIAQHQGKSGSVTVASLFTNLPWALLVSG
jgi:(1->4)-alpha-D-glucan 1-alpha-D-glucosylmutase